MKHLKNYKWITTKTQNKTHQKLKNEKIKLQIFSHISDIKDKNP